MGNLACCVSKPATGPNGVEEDTKIHQILEEDRKRNIDEGLRNMANGGHQLIAGFTAPHVFKREPGKSYYPFNWGSEGSVPITSFGVKIVASGNDVQFVEGLANYATFMCSWKPDNKEGHLLITLDNYKSVDANTGEETPVNTPPKKFLVDREGNFVGIVNLDELVNEAVEQAVAVAGGQDDKTEEQKQELKKILMQQRDVMVKGVVGDVSLMWRCWVQVWTHEERLPNEETEVYGFKCVRRKKVLGSDAEENKQTLRKFYDDLFDNLNKSSQGSINQDKSPTNGKKKGGRDAKERQSQSSFRPEVILEQAKQLEVYNALFVSDGVRCHQSSYRKFTESSITIQGENTERAEFEGKRWVFGWRDIPMLSSRAYMVSLFSEYATVAGAFHDALQEKYNDNANHNIFEMLVSHPFVTEPNEEVIKADKDKQKIAAMNQMAGGAHSMFSGLSPPIKYEERTNPSSYYSFNWPREGSVKVYALGFTIKITDGEAKFTQGLGTFITFVVRWQPAQLEGHTDVFLENNVLIVAATGAEEPLPEPVKHILVDRTGALVRVVNMDQLVSYAVDTAIQQKGNISDDEKKSYRDMLEKTQKETLTKAVECDLSFIWASWVQMWVHQQKGAHAEHDAFGKTCVTLERSNESSPDENKKTVLSLINSVLGEEKKNEFEIKVEVAKQSERYKTVFEKDTLRPHDAKYEKITETVLSFGSHQVHQKEFKNSCHVFIWPDIPKLATKEYATAVYQNYLNLANNMYDELRPSAAPQ